MFNPRVVGPVRAEDVFLRVGATEDIIACEIDGEDDEGAQGAELDRVDGQIARLQGVDEGQPDQVAEGEHETETVRGDVHGREDGWLVPERVEDVDPLEDGHQKHTIGYVAVQFVLMRHERQIEKEPAQHARSKLAEDFDVDRPEIWNVHARIQFAPYEPVVDQIASESAGGEVAVGIILPGSDGETSDVDEAS